MAVTSAAVTSAAVRTITAGVHRHWLLGPIGSNVNQCSIAPRSLTAYRDAVQRQCSYLTSHCPTLEVPFLQEDGPDGGVVAAVEPVDSEHEEAEEEDMDNRDSVIQQYFQ
ncbi:hypothetical protein NDU88_004790 [Pleurodeles waltl]|uniref:Uncharacterized protein n=1 Tax=Pleurodeles waltl TaxID=8319 RepID=A0AAV7RHU7_PLEWA|nr:hypothetical protein NDU88_004790 [Pleurodeles waltl]